MKKLSMVALLCCIPLQTIAQTLAIGIDAGQGTQVARQSRQLLEKLSELTGIVFNIQELPSARLQQYFVIDGTLEAALPHAVGVYKDYAGKVVQVPEVIMQTRIFVYSAKPIAFKELADIKDRKFISVTGLKATNALLDTAGINSQQQVKDVEIALKMISVGRADAVLIPDIFAQTALNSKELTGFKIIQNPTVVSQVDAYIWLSPKKSALSEKLVAAIRQLKNSGELAKIYSSTQ